jgi:hypothetical protein
MFVKATSKKQLLQCKRMAGSARAKLADLELYEKDIAGAVAWSRNSARKAKI